MYKPWRYLNLLNAIIRKRSGDPKWGASQTVSKWTRVSDQLFFPGAAYIGHYFFPTLDKLILQVVLDLFDYLLLGSLLNKNKDVIVFSSLGESGLCCTWLGHGPVAG